LACDLTNASREFEGIIQNRKNNLDYLQQLSATYEASQNGTWGKIENIVINVLSDAAGDDIKDLVGGELNFETLKNTISYIALVRPDAFGTVLASEIDRLEEFFRDEMDIINMLIDYLDEAIDELVHNWTNLGYNNFKEMQQYELNQLMNSDVPKVGRDIAEVKSILVRLESEVYNQNTSGDLTMNTINNIIYKLENARNELDDPSNDSIISNLIKLLDLWDQIKEAVEKLSGPSSSEFTNLSDFFKEVGDNFRDSINGMMGTLTLIREAVSNLDTVDTMMFEDWENSVSSLMRNLNRYQGSQSLKLSLDNYIQNKVDQTIDVNFPVISTVINRRTFDKWEDNANFSKLNKSTWVNLLNIVIDKLNQVADTGSDTLLAYDNIYAPLIQDIINAYIDVSAPYWSFLMKKYNEVYKIIQLLAEGGEVTKDLVVVLTEFKNAALSFKNVLGNRINTFETEDPKGALETAMNITHETTTMVSGVIMMADYLGLDHMSDLVQRGDIAGVLDLDKKDADSTQQILNDLACLDEANDITKSIGVEIRKIIVAEKDRKKRLQNDTTQTMKNSLSKEKEEIEKLEDMNRRFKTNIKEV
jgi:hypothetical protein